MKKHSLWVRALLFSVAFSVGSSCTDDYTDVTGTNRIAVVFTPQLEGNEPLPSSSRVVNTTWSGGEEVGVAMLNSGAGITGTSSFAKYGVAVSAGSEVTFSPSGSEDILYFPTDAGKNVNFAAFSPYTDINGTKVTYDGFAGQSTQAGMESVDFIYCKDDTDYNKNSTGPVVLNFSHQLRKLLIKIKTTNDLAAIDLTGITGVEVSRLPAGVQIDLSDLTLTPSGAAGTRFFGASKSVSQVTYTAIVVPHDTSKQTGNTGRVLKVYMGSGSFEYHFSDSFSLASGSVYTFNFTLSKTGLEQVGSTTITGWDGATVGDGSTGNIEMN